MRMRELRAFTGESLRNHHKMAWFRAWSLPVVWLMIKSVPDLLAAALILKTETSPAELFFGRNPLWIVFTILWHMLGFCILMPMLCGMCGWFSHRLGLGKVQHFFRNRKLFWKGVYFFGQIECIRFLVLFPFMLFCFLAGKCFSQCALIEEAGLWLFLSVQCIISAVWTGIYYLRFCTGLCAVPFLFLENTEIPALRAVITSRKILAGQHRKLFLIICTGLFLPHTVTMLILFLQIRIREYAQENPI